MDTGVRLEKKPARKTNFFNWIFLTWPIPLFWTGAHRDLLATDLDSPSEADESERVADALEREWRLEIERTRVDLALLENKSGKETLSKRKPSLLKAILRVFWFPYMLNGLFLFIEEVILRVLQPWFQRRVIEYFTQATSEERLSKTAAYLHALGLLGTTFAIIVISHHVTLSMRQIGMRIRVACSSLVYRKVLRLELGTIRNTAAGRVINLLSNDVSRFDKIVCFLHFIWIMPIQMTVIGYVMWQYVGVSAIIGIAAVVTQTIPMQGYLSLVSARLRALIAIRTDARVQIMNELIAGIQVLKMYAWERPFELMVSGLRAAEMKSIGHSTYVRAFYWSAMTFAERINLYCTLTSFVMMGNLLTPECAFVLLTFFNTIQITSAFGFPQALITSGETGVSIKRLEEFLMLDEVKRSKDLETAKIDGAVVKNGIAKIANHDRIKIKIDKVTGSWTRDQIPPTLSNVSMVLESQSLCGLVGPVGSGKSSLLHSILGELPISSGTLKFYTEAGLDVSENRCNLRVSYCCQEPWLFSGTIRDNVLLGQSYDEKRYDEVIRICALQKDFEQLPQRDMTHVGERGSSLSGGQRVRVNLARAIYRVADVYLFDDLFSAVDTRVGHHLFHECIKRYLRGTTRIIVTHQLHLLKQVDTVVVLDRGSVKVQGTFDTLSKSDLSFLKTEGDGLDVDKDGVESGECDEDEDRLTRRFSRRKTLSHRKAHANKTEIVESTDIPEELVQRGKLSANVYATYFRAGGNAICITFLMACYIAGQVAMSGVDYWLSYWTDEQTTKSRILSTLSNTTRNENVTVSLWYDEFGLLNPEVAVSIYTIILITCVALVILRSMWFMKNNMNSSRKLHNRMFFSLLRTKMRFFNATPSGRILNRFSKDIGTMDEVLPQAMMEGLQSFLLMLGIISLVIIANYWMVIPTIVIGVIYYIIGSYYIKTAQDVKRLEGVAKSPVFSHVNSTLSGLTTIRSRGDVTVSLLRKDFDRYQDIHTAAWYTTLSTAEAFGFVLDLLSCLFIACVCFLFLSNEDDTISGSNVGLAISQSLILTGMLQYGIRQSAEVVAQMTAVERVLQYTNLPQEGSLVSSKPPSLTWPSEGRVKFEKVNLKYNEEGPTVLKNLNFEIQPGWKIGIVGRTGAGKSSLISALFRLVDNGLTGDIIVDSVDIKSIGLHELRPKISIIPQEPILFSASLRFNLDPFGEYTDAQLWDCLREAELSDTVPSLDHQVAEGGANFSAGQRQLICLARAILRNNRILVLDEATANIDPHTDALIQQTIRKRFADCTVLTIAHRLNTIMDSNLVLVIEQGSIVEFDHPHLLLQNPDSHFSRMVEQTGKSMGEILARTAAHTYYVSRNESERNHRNHTNFDCTINPTS